MLNFQGFMGWLMKWLWMLSTFEERRHQGCRIISTPVWPCRVIVELARHVSRRCVCRIKRKYQAEHRLGSQTKTRISILSALMTWTSLLLQLPGTSPGTNQDIPIWPKWLKAQNQHKRLVAQIHKLVLHWRTRSPICRQSESNQREWNLRDQNLT